MVKKLLLTLPLVVMVVILVSACSGEGGREFSFSTGPYSGPDFGGGWTGKITLTGSEDSDFALSINQAGKNYAGSLEVGGAVDYVSGEVRGTIENDGAFSFAVVSDGEAIATFVGNVSGDTITGVWSTTTASGTFSGERA